jgi:hypothetical protein
MRSYPSRRLWWLSRLWSAGIIRVKSGENPVCLILLVDRVRWYGLKCFTFGPVCLRCIPVHRSLIPVLSNFYSLLCHKRRYLSPVIIPIKRTLVQVMFTLLRSNLKRWALMIASCTLDFDVKLPYITKRMR